MKASDQSHPVAIATGTITAHAIESRRFARFHEHHLIGESYSADLRARAASRRRASSSGEFRGETGSGEGAAVTSLLGDTDALAPVGLLLAAKSRLSRTHAANGPSPAARSHRVFCCFVQSIGGSLASNCFGRPVGLTCEQPGRRR